MRKLIIVMISILMFLTGYTRETSGRFKGIPLYYPPKIFLIQSDSSTVYKLFPTENMWTFLKLNTRNGRIWQVQYDVKGNDRFEISLNLFELVTIAEEVNGRFNLYPTQNMYTFILLDQLNGKTWQVQWSTDRDKSFIIPIK